jgi:hypothetical protein
MSNGRYELMPRTSGDPENFLKALDVAAEKIRLCAKNTIEEATSLCAIIGTLPQPQIRD